MVGTRCALWNEMPSAMGCARWDEMADGKSGRWEEVRLVG